MTDPGRLQRKLDNRDFVFTAEIVPGLAVDAGAFLARAAVLEGRVDAVNVTDGAGARVAMSSLAAAALLVRAGIEPVLQMTCRDRNRIALAADLVGAAALGIRNILALRGDAPEGGDEPDATPVYDLDSEQLIRTAAGMRDAGTLPSGRELDGRPAFVIGAADVPFLPPADWQPDGLRAKLRAGIDFVQTQFCFDPGLAERYFDRLREAGVLDEVPMIVGVGPILSAHSARWMNEHLYGVNVPEALIRRLDSAADPAAEGQRICVELIETYRDMPAVAGVHIMAPAQGPQRIAAVIDAVRARQG